MVADMAPGAGVRSPPSERRENTLTTAAPVFTARAATPTFERLYSGAVFDLHTGPVTITMPDPRGRFMSLQAIDEDQYTLETVYAPGRFTYTKDRAGTRYVLIGLRTSSIRQIPVIWRRSTLSRTRLPSSKRTPARGKLRTGIKRARTWYART
jgi:hypothetical protein